MTTLVDNRKAAADGGNMFRRPLDTSRVRTDHYDFLGGIAKGVDVFVNDGGSRQMIEGNVEESLNLSGMEIKGDDAVSPRAFEKVGAKFRRNRDASFVFAILTRVSEIGNDRRNTVCACAAATVDHYEKLHERVVYRTARRLNDKDVFAANVFFDSTERFAVGKLFYGHIAQGLAEILANLFT